MSEIFIQTFFLYFIVIDPLGNTPLFLSITQNMDTNKKIRIALSASIIASIILLFFALLGSSLLSYLNISYPAFTIGGGIILLIIAIEMLFDKRQQRKGEDLDLNSDNVSVFPLATPIIAGPAAITSVIVSVSDIGTNFTNQTVGMLSSRQKKTRNNYTHECGVGINNRSHSPSYIQLAKGYKVER